MGTEATWSEFIRWAGEALDPELDRVIELVKSERDAYIFLATQFHAEDVEGFDATFASLKADWFQILELGGREPPGARDPLALDELYRHAEEELADFDAWQRHEAPPPSLCRSLIAEVRRLRYQLDGADRLLHLVPDEAARFFSYASDPLARLSLYELPEHDIAIEVIVGSSRKPAARMRVRVSPKAQETLMRLLLERVAERALATLTTEPARSARVNAAPGAGIAYELAAAWHSHETDLAFRALRHEDERSVRAAEIGTFDRCVQQLCAAFRIEPPEFTGSAELIPFLPKRVPRRAIEIGPHGTVRDSKPPSEEG